MVERPLTDVSLMREEPPELLKTAAAEPYRLSEPFDCEAARAEIAELRAVLGPDLDERTDDEEGAAAGRLATNAIAGLVSLPFRGVVRWISGAERREKVLAEAILAGMVRRGYLKGAMRAGCESPVED